MCHCAKCKCTQSTWYIMCIVSRVCALKNKCHTLVSLNCCPYFLPTIGAWARRLGLEKYATGTHHGYTSHMSYFIVWQSDNGQMMSERVS